SVTQGSEAVLDQSAVAIQSGFLFNEGAHFRFAVAHGLRKRAMSKPMGMLEPGDSDVHDRGRSLHTRVRILRGDNSKTFRSRRRRTPACGRGGAPNEIKTCRDYCRRT